MWMYKTNVGLSGYVNAMERMKQTKEAVESENAEIGKVGRFAKVRNQNVPQDYYDTKDKIVYPQEDTVPVSKLAAEEAKPLPEMLAYAGRFQTDDGMTAYLKRNVEKLPEEDRRIVETLLQYSPEEIRKEISRITGA